MQPLETPEQITVGALDLELGQNSFSTTFYQSFIDKLPMQPQ